MLDKTFARISLIAAALAVIAAWQLSTAPAAFGEEPKVMTEAEMKTEFLKLCDIQGKIVYNQPESAGTGRKKTRTFYWDSYVVRALCVAYDMTGKKEYLDTCKKWSDLMIGYQKDMIPAGAYYMQYYRKPGEKEGWWYAADCSSIAMGVLATAVRCDDPVEKKKYLDSVKAFAKLVNENFVRPSGGVTDGYWAKSKDEWWCSTGIFGSLSFLLYKETGDEQYLKVGLGALDWLNKQDWKTMDVFYEKIVNDPTIIAYCLEGYSPAFPYLEPGSERYKATMVKWDFALTWMKENFGGAGGREYVSQWGSKMGYSPFHMYRYAHNVPNSEEFIKIADKELTYAKGVLDKTPATNPKRNQVALFMMMSYAERLSPGAMYRSSKEKPADK